MHRPRSAAGWNRRAAVATAGAALLLAPMATASATLPTPAASTVVAPHGMDLVADGVFATAETDRVAPGLDVTRFSRQEEAGWTAGAVMVADLSVPTLSVDVVNSGAVTEPATVSEHLANNGAVAAINGDFFDINYSDAANGTAVSRDGVLNGTSTPRAGLTITEGLAAVQGVAAVATVTVDGTDHRAGGVNTPHLPAGSVGVYTPAWGGHTLDRPVGGPESVSPTVRRATVVDGVVTAIGLGGGAPSIPEDGFVLLGREAGADLVASLSLGDEVGLDITTDVGADVALTGGEVLIADGVVVAADTAVHPRTAVGVSEDGTQLFALALDGRAHFGRGMSTIELAELLADLGAHDAVNLDGGGSTTMVARLAGDAETTVLNRPSDGVERPVPNSLAFFSSAPAGTATDVAVAPVSDLDGADTVLPGLHRTLAGTGLDANLAPVAVDGTFTVGSDAVTLTTDGATAVVQGEERGRATLTYAAGGLTAATGIEVLGALDHVRADRNVIALEATDDAATIHLTGYDADGHGSPIEVQDVTVTAPEGFTITPDGVDAFTVASSLEQGGGTASLVVGDAVVELALTVGFEEVEVLDLADAADWTYDVARATGETAPAEGPEAGTNGLRLTYDFTTSTSTRGFYAIAPEPVVLPGQPRSLTLWVKGSGNGEWPRLQVRTGEGVVTNLDGALVEWEGWQQVSFPVPAGMAYPLTFERVRMMETRPDAQYAGDVTVGPLSVVLAADVDAPQVTPVHDPVIVTDGTVTDRPLQVAVMSDAQFVAANPTSPLVEAARRTLREIVAAEPDVLVINGDLVDEAAPADFDLARTVLTEEVGDAVPWVYVPGNHEIMGGPISNFIEEFGAPSTARTLDGTRLITLNTAGGTYLSGGIEQLRMLEEQLADAAADPAVSGVLVFSHHPTEDPLPNKASQLGDREEAAAIERTLAAFRSGSGKSAAMVNGHVGVFHGRSSEGVSYLVNGNSGKGPSGTPATGGFTGWTMLGVDPAAGVVGDVPAVPDARLAWMRAEVMARVDALHLAGPDTLEVGESATAGATLVQDEGREVPVAWPVSAQWGGDDVRIDDGSVPAGDEDDALEEAGGVLRYNPRTGALTALSGGVATLTVTVNGVTAELDVTVPEPEVPTEDPTDVPTEDPTDLPTEEPTDLPTEEPTGEPTPDPTDGPSDGPSDGAPGGEPTTTPTRAPGEGGPSAGRPGGGADGGADGGAGSGGALPSTGADGASVAVATALALAAAGVLASLGARRRAARAH
ncbi:phosphodiester glycosidase family protein [Georgenia faecalis]|uniref:phosphodiester glycosidase family protein n=1 Tax=Georgenia faecalis TaxID=2483799 RepID=UPI000FD8B7A3|nr:phosphodiester glycosidase family protein [Georgenia faecalis]